MVVIVVAICCCFSHSAYYAFWLPTRKSTLHRGGGGGGQSRCSWFTEQGEEIFLQSMDQTGHVANLVRGQLNKIFFFSCPHSHLKI